MIDHLGDYQSKITFESMDEGKLEHQELLNTNSLGFYNFHNGVMWELIGGAANINLEDFKDFLNASLYGQLRIHGKTFVLNKEGYFIQEVARETVKIGRLDINRIIAFSDGIAGKDRFLGYSGQRLDIKQVLKYAKYLINQGYLTINAKEQRFEIKAGIDKQSMFIMSSPYPVEDPKFAFETIRHEAMHCFFNNHKEYREWCWNNIFSKLNTRQRSAIINYMLHTAESGEYFFSLSCKGSPILLVDELLAFSIEKFEGNTVDLKKVIDNMIRLGSLYKTSGSIGDFKGIVEMTDYYFRKEYIINDYNKSDLNW